MSLIEDAGPGPRGSAGAVPGTTAGAARYSRFDADVAAMQRDSSTYCDEPEDGDDYRAWLAGFDLAAHRPDVERLIAENTFMSELQVRRACCAVQCHAVCWVVRWVVCCSVYMGEPSAPGRPSAAARRPASCR